MKFSLDHASQQIKEIQQCLSENKDRPHLTHEQVKELCRDLATIRQVLCLFSFIGLDEHKADSLKERCTGTIEVYNP